MIEITTQVSRYDRDHKSYKILPGYPRFPRANNRLPLQVGLLGIGGMVFGFSIIPNPSYTTPLPNRRNRRGKRRLPRGIGYSQVGFGIRSNSTSKTPIQSRSSRRGAQLNAPTNRDQSESFLSQRSIGVEWLPARVGHLWVGVPVGLRWRGCPGSIPSRLGCGLSRHWLPNPAATYQGCAFCLGLDSK
jgi:hypothetical protein